MKGNELQKINNSIQQFKEYFDKKYPCDTIDSCGDVLPQLDQLKWDKYQLLILLHRILSATACTTVDEVIGLLISHKPTKPLTK